MGARRLGGSLAALLSGGGVVVGGTTAVPVAAALVAGSLLAAVVAYLFGDRRLPLPVCTVLYLGAGGGILAGTVPAPTPLAWPLLAVAGLLGVGFVVRVRLGNARRVATLPVNPGRRRRWEATLARRVLGIQSAVGWAWNLGVGPVGVGAAALTLAWAGAVGGLAVLWAEVPGPPALAAETGLLLALPFPFYRGTDWIGVDAPDGPTPASTGERLAAVPAAFRREVPTPPEETPTESSDATTGEEPAETEETAPVSAGGSDASGPDDVPTGGGDTVPDDEEVAELPSAAEMGPASWGASDDADDAPAAEAGGVAPEGEAGGGEAPAELPPAPDDPRPRGRDGEGTGDGAGPDGWERVPPADDDDGDAMPSVPEVEGSLTEKPAVGFGVGGDDGPEVEDGDEEDEPDDVTAILDDRADRPAIDPDASPAREAFGVYERVSEILGSGDRTNGDDWRDEDDGGEGETAGDDADGGEDEGGPDEREDGGDPAPGRS